MTFSISKSTHRTGEPQKWFHFLLRNSISIFLNSRDGSACLVKTWVRFLTWQLLTNVNVTFIIRLRPMSWEFNRKVICRQFNGKRVVWSTGATQPWTTWFFFVRSNLHKAKYFGLIFNEFYRPIHIWENFVDKGKLLIMSNFSFCLNAFNFKHFCKAVSN